MPKPDPALLDPARYPFTCVIEPRFGDLDFNRHINNVALCGLLEEARVRFHTVCGHDDREGLAPMAVSFSVEYLGQGSHPEPLQIHVAASKVGRTSLTVSELATQDGRVVAYAQAVLVYVKDGRPVELAEKFAARLMSLGLRE